MIQGLQNKTQNKTETPGHDSVHKKLFYWSPPKLSCSKPFSCRKSHLDIKKIFCCPEESCNRSVPCDFDYKTNKKHHVCGESSLPSAHTVLIKRPAYDLTIVSHDDDLQLNWRKRTSIQLFVRAKARRDSRVHADRYKTASAQWLMA